MEGTIFKMINEKMLALKEIQDEEVNLNLKEGLLRRKKLIGK